MNYARLYAAGAAALAFLMATGALAAPVDQAEILAAHNKYRAEVGVPPLIWSIRLAASAQTWAERIAALGQLKHSGTAGMGENLAFATAGHMSLSQLVGLWAVEKQNFKAGTFPDVSTTGNWRDVGHYTQMVWRDTTEVGCATALGGGKEYLVCQYASQGNIEGEKVY